MWLASERPQIIIEEIQSGRVECEELPLGCHDATERMKELAYEKGKGREFQIDLVTDGHASASIIETKNGFVISGNHLIFAPDFYEN